MINAPFAADPARSRGRLHPQPPSATRDAFSRDRDRIVHSVAFRRLRGKTQVFAAPEGDHFRVRLTHTLEVAQIARTIARALGLNEDLTEACALAHDLGHPPFGHAGETALADALAGFGGWDHNGHTLRVVTLLETPYPAFDGLNLSWETLEGLAKHNGPVTAPGWALQDANAQWSLDLLRWPGLEAQVAAIADDIAYDCHDLDDAMRSGLIDLETALSEPFLADCWSAARARFPLAPVERVQPELIREALGRMVADLIGATRGRLEAFSDTAAALEAGVPLVGFTAEMTATERALKGFLYARFYHHPAVARVTEPASECVRAIFAALANDPARLPEAWAAALPSGNARKLRYIADYIAGMTDRFAIREHARLIGPSPLPDHGF